MWIKLLDHTVGFRRRDRFDPVTLVSQNCEYSRKTDPKLEARVQRYLAASVALEWLSPILSVEMACMAALLRQQGS